MLYKILHKVFGWDYIYWENSADNGVARVHIINNGVFYWRYKNTQVLDEINDITQVLWLTCSPNKYEKYINKERRPRNSVLVDLFNAYNENSRQLAEFKKLIETNNATRI